MILSIFDQIFKILYEKFSPIPYKHHHLVKNEISTIIMTRQSYLNAYISAAIQ